MVAGKVGSVMRIERRLNALDGRLPTPKTTPHAVFDPSKVTAEESDRLDRIRAKILLADGDIEKALTAHEMEFCADIRGRMDRP
jgi:hypothetical protein